MFYMEIVSILTDFFWEEDKISLIIFYFRNYSRKVEKLEVKVIIILEIKKLLIGFLPSFKMT